MATTKNITMKQFNRVDYDTLNPATQASQTSYDNSTTGSTATTVQGVVDELFLSVSNGKSAIASAITNKGVSTSSSASFQTMADNIESISPTLQSKTVSPSTDAQTIAPDSGYDGLSAVTVNAIPSEYVNVSDTTAEAKYVFKGAVFYQKDGTRTIGTFDHDLVGHSVTLKNGSSTKNISLNIGRVSKYVNKFDSHFFVPESQTIGFAPSNTFPLFIPAICPFVIIRKDGSSGWTNYTVSGDISFLKSFSDEGDQNYMVYVFVFKNVSASSSLNGTIEFS